MGFLAEWCGINAMRLLEQKLSAADRCDEMLAALEDTILEGGNKL
jgi:hypothetical protein